MSTRNHPAKPHLLTLSWKESVHVVVGACGTAEHEFPPRKWRHSVGVCDDTLVICDDLLLNCDLYKYIVYGLQSTTLSLTKIPSKILQRKYTKLCLLPALLGIKRLEYFKPFMGDEIVLPSGSFASYFKPVKSKPI